MRLVGYHIDITNKLPGRHLLARWTLKKRLMVALIPPILFILVLTGYLTAWISNNYLEDEVKKTLQVQAAALSRHVESFFEHCTKDLHLLSQSPITQNNLADFAKSRKKLYRATAFIANNRDNSIFILNHKEKTIVVPPDKIFHAYLDPVTLPEEIGKFPRGEVFFTTPRQAMYPSLSIAHFDHRGDYQGFFLLSIDVDRLMDILSEVRSTQSRLFGFGDPSGRCAYLMDLNGEIYLSSVPLKGSPTPLKVSAKQGINNDNARSEDINLPGCEINGYRTMVEDIQQGKQGTVQLPAFDTATADSKYYLHGYCPLFMPGDSEDNKKIFGGVVLADRSNIALWAHYAHINLIFVIMLGSTIVISLLIIAVSRVIARPILNLAAAAEKIHQTGRLEEIEIAEAGEETVILQTAINSMLSTLRSQMEEIEKKDEQIQEQSKRERARLKDEVAALKKRLQVHTIEEIIGGSPVIASLKSDIFQAASVDADVLIMGETGSGKQLVAEAVHKHSRRWDKPFISVNCGALDENLLVDTLFGHTKGAFTGAKDDRKGAFVAAGGGTLFLDEIGCASPRVQQSLLTALSTRKVKHLGSDHEVAVDVRLIAATNLDLKDMIQHGTFREDLYYRLEVLTIKTPPLRERKEDIPLLLHHFLREATGLMNKDIKDFSKGAVEKMIDYHWPGNVRELMNCVTRAVAMARGTIIRAHDITLGDDKSTRLPKKYIITQDELFSPSRPTVHSKGIPPGLNERQKKVFPFLTQNRTISRSRYQKLAGPDISARTAVYDLQDLVKKGILKKIGKGPATRYHLVELENKIG